MNSFPKQQRITSQKLIDELFTSGHSHSLVAFPLRVVYVLRPVAAVAAEDSCPSPHPTSTLQLLVSVPKKRLHHAVDRNRAKRQLREAFRMRSSHLLACIPAGQSLAMAVVWLSDTPQPSSLVTARMDRLMRRIGTDITKHGAHEVDT